MVGTDGSWPLREAPWPRFRIGLKAAPLRLSRFLIPTSPVDRRRPPSLARAGE